MSNEDKPEPVAGELPPTYDWTRDGMELSSAGMYVSFEDYSQRSAQPVQQPAAVAASMPDDAVSGVDLGDGSTAYYTHVRIAGKWFPFEDIVAALAIAERAKHAIPAAGVQGDDAQVLKAQLEATVAVADSNYKLCMQYKREADALWKRVNDAEAKLATLHPDSGRDAALEEAAKACEALAPEMSSGIGAGAAQDCATAIRALAAHPANGAQAGDAGFDYAKWFNDEMHGYFSYSGNKDHIMWANVEDIKLFGQAAILAAAKKGQ